MNYDEHRNLHLKYLKTEIKFYIKTSLCHWMMQLKRETRILVELHAKSEKALEEFLLAFIRRTQDLPLVQFMAKLIQLLVGDAPISSVVPLMNHQHLLDIFSCYKWVSSGKQFSKEETIWISTVVHSK